MITFTNRNKLIAEFMGVKTITIDELKSTLKQNRENGFIQTPQAHVVDDLKYHTSWDWLMPVVLKTKDTATFDNCIDGIDFVLTCDCTIENLYTEVVEFIKEYKIAEYNERQ